MSAATDLIRFTPLPAPSGAVSWTPTSSVLYVLDHGCVIVGGGAMVASALHPLARLLFSVPPREAEGRFDAAGGSRPLAVAIKPFRADRFEAPSMYRVGLIISPSHPCFSRFAAVPEPGVIRLPSSFFTRVDLSFGEFRGETPSIEAASRFFDTAIEGAVQQLPQGMSADRRIERVLRMLEMDPALPLKELAASVGLSYCRMSHLFTERVGLPLRSYLLWQKVDRAARLLLAASDRDRIGDVALQAGFTDHAHLSRSFRSVFGFPPSRLVAPGIVVGAL